MINWLHQIPPMTRLLLLANIGFYLLTLLLGHYAIDLNIILGSFYPESLNFKWWQPFTHLFIHANITHIGFNMMALYLFGSPVENIIGPKRFIILYGFAGLGAFILFNAQSAYDVIALKDTVSNLGIDPVRLQAAMRLDYAGHPATPYVPNIPSVIELCQYYLSPMVGASGAIYGLFIAYGLLYPQQKLFIPGLLILELTLGLLDFSWNPIAHFAHLGGALFGFIIMQYWFRRYRQKA